MTKMSSTVIAFVIALIAISHDIAQPADPLPESIISALKANSDGLVNMELHGFQERRFLVSASRGLNDLRTKETKEDFTQRIGFELKLQGLKYYENLQYQPSRFHGPDEKNEMSYDGAKHYAGSFRPTIKEQQGNLNIQSPSKLAKFKWAVAAMWYLREAGFEPPGSISALGVPIRSAVLARIESGRLLEWRKISDGGRDLVEVVIEYPESWASNKRGRLEDDPNINTVRPSSVKTMTQIEKDRRSISGQTRHCRFLLDPKLNYAVREKREQRDTGETMFHTVCEDFVQIEQSPLWLPKKCAVNSYAYETHPLFTSTEAIYVTDIQLTEIDRKKFTDSDFQIWYDSPGSMVTDYTHPEAVGGQAVAFFVPGATGKIYGAENVDRGPSRWLIPANVVVILIIGAVAWMRYRRNASRS